ncbi:MAG: hypothetical protein FIB00_11940 [Chloroflexi bacterium]|nr:hypothetical protein [Dehalococcoidia bacterium]NJD65934.1 hypothetical protein [Chloroflexota bacterium]PWB44978.1 MAG: hypothetical protein C3F10_07145 [Dehalococcoidia bacterium]
MATTDHRFQFRIPEATWQRLVAIAERERRTLNAQLLIYLEAGLTQDDAAPAMRLGATSRPLGASTRPLGAEAKPIAARTRPLGARRVPLNQPRSRGGA